MSILQWFRRRQLSPSATRATSSQPSDATAHRNRLESDRGVVSLKLPPNTSEQLLEGVTYWVYSFTCQLGRQYSLAAYFDGSEYQVKILTPTLKKTYGVHDAHVFSNGRICLNPPANGAASLEEAYAKSVVWATGFSVFEEVGKFPFSANNK